MKTKAKLLLIILSFIFAYGFSGGDGNKEDDFRKLENKAFKEGEKLDVAGLNEIIVLLDRSETEKTEVALNIWPPNLDGPPHKHDEKEQIFYFTSGKGIVKIGKDSFTRMFVGS